MSHNITPEILKDLNIEREEIVNLIERYGLDGTMHNLGNSVHNYDYQIFAGRLLLKKIKQNTGKNIQEYLELMKNVLNDDVYDYILKHESIWNEVLDKYDSNDLNYDWLSANSLVKNYMMRIDKDKDPIESLQQLWMRVSCQLYYKRPIEEAIECFEMLSNKKFVHATPTLCNSGTKKPQLSSCFLIKLNNKLLSILEGVVEIGMLNKHMGGVGVDVSDLAGEGAHLWNGYKITGIIPWLKIFDATIRAVNQGGKRNGVANVVNNVYHYDVQDFIDLTLKKGDHNSRAHDINTTLWIPWLFWDRLRKKQDWTLFCPTDTPELNKTYGREWIELYTKYENDPNITRKIVLKASKLYDQILSVQQNSGMPYMMNRDSCNFKSNHNHYGIVGTNLCLEIIQHVESENAPVCNLGSIPLHKHLKKIYDNQNENFHYEFDFQSLGKCTSKLTNNLYNGIQNNWYPLDEQFGVVEKKFSKINSLSRRLQEKLKEHENVDELFDLINELKTESDKFVGKPRSTNNRYCPIGIGTSGFIDALYKIDKNIVIKDKNNRYVLNPEVKLLNKKIFACIYFNSLVESVKIAIETGNVYERFEESTMGQGKLQFDLWEDEYYELKDLGLLNEKQWTEEDNIIVNPQDWGQEPIVLQNDFVVETWEDLKYAIVNFGSALSLTTSPMPTATSSQITKSNETNEPPQSNLYTRKLISGSFTVVNRHLIKDLKKIGINGKYVETLLRQNDGSIQNIKKYLDRFPEFNKDFERLDQIILKYMTVWEIPQKVLIDLSADRGRYIDQSQSLNAYIRDASKRKLAAFQNYAVSKGLKTLEYYLRQETPNTSKVMDVPTKNYKKNILPNLDSETFEDNEICTSCQC